MIRRARTAKGGGLNESGSPREVSSREGSTIKVVVKEVEEEEEDLFVDEHIE